MSAALLPLLVALTLGQSTAIYGKTASGTQVEVKLNDDGSLAPGGNTPTSTSAFGATLTTSEVPITFLDFPYNINTLLVTTTVANGGTVTQSSSRAVLQTSSAANGSAIMESKDRVRYVPGQGIFVRFTAIFTPCVAGSTEKIGIGDSLDGYFFGCFGGSFGFDRVQNGVDNVTAIGAFNGTVPVGFDLTKGNVYAIQYQWLGFGAVREFIEDSTSGALFLVNTVRYANTATTPTVFNPSLPLHVEVTNSGNGTNLTLMTSSMSAVAEGPRLPDIGSRQSFTNSKAGVGTSLTNCYTLQNRATFNGATNRTQIRVDHVSPRVNGAGDGFFALIRNTTLGGAPSFVDVDTTRSIAATDTAGTTVTGGTTVFNFSGSGTNSIDLTPYNILIAPGDTLTCAEASETGTITGRCSMSWVEEY